MLYTTFYRVWAKARIQWVKAWEYSEAGALRDYWWGGVGKACDRAMWKHAIKDELASSPLPMSGATMYVNMNFTKKDPTSRGGPSRNATRGSKGLKSTTPSSHQGLQSAIIFTMAASFRPSTSPKNSLNKC